MKTQSNIVLAVILTLVATFSLPAAAYAEEGEMIVRVERKTGKAIDVRLANLRKQRTEVSLSDVHGKVWFSEYAWGVHGYAKRLDLEGMPAGEYVLLIENKYERYVRVFTKTPGNLFFFDNGDLQKDDKVMALLTRRNATPAGALISRFTADGAHGVDVQLANLLGTPTVLQLKTMTGSTVYEERIEGRHGYAKKIDLAGLAKGNYYFLVRTGKRIQVQFFENNTKSVVLQERQRLDPGSLNEKLALQ